MRQRFSPDKTLLATLKERYYSEHPERSPLWPTLYFSDDAVMHRYHLPAWPSVTFFFLEAGLWHLVSGSDIDRIMLLDYDLPPGRSLIDEPLTCDELRALAQV